MARRLLPIGIQNFRKLRESNCYYADKTGYALRLVEEGAHYFLSRPRRFGKSLFLDTLKALFQGSRELFKGLHIHDHWDWAVRYPVVKLSFGGGNFNEPGYLQSGLMEQLAAIERSTSTEQFAETSPGRLRDLLGALHRRTGQRVAVLVDEYDKPILDALEEPEVARANRDYLHGLYSVIKQKRTWPCCRVPSRGRPGEGACPATSERVRLSRIGSRCVRSRTVSLEHRIESSWFLRSWHGLPFVPDNRCCRTSCSPGAQGAPVRGI